MKYGYARVSTDDQSTALQLTALKKAGCKTVFKDEGLSGATTKRPALLRCLKTLTAGDTLIVWKLDRLGRSLRDLIHMLDDVRAYLHTDHEEAWDLAKRMQEAKKASVRNPPCQCDVRQLPLSNY